MGYWDKVQGETVDARDASPLMRNVRQVEIQYVEASTLKRDGKRPLPLRATFRAVFVSEWEKGQLAWNGGATRADLEECKRFCAARGISILR